MPLPGGCVFFLAAGLAGEFFDFAAGAAGLFAADGLLAFFNVDLEADMEMDGKGRLGYNSPMIGAPKRFPERAE